MRKKARGRSFRVFRPLGIRTARSPEAGLCGRSGSAEGRSQGWGKAEEAVPPGRRRRVWEEGVRLGRGFPRGRGFREVGLQPPWPVTRGPVRSERPWRHAP